MALPAFTYLSVRSYLKKGGYSVAPNFFCFLTLIRCRISTRGLFSHASHSHTRLRSRNKSSKLYRTRRLFETRMPHITHYLKIAISIDDKETTVTVLQRGKTMKGEYGYHCFHYFLSTKSILDFISSESVLWTFLHSPQSSFCCQLSFLFSTLGICSLPGTFVGI